MRTERVSRKVSAWRARVRSTLLSVAILLLAFAILFWPRVGSAAPCTRGVNCYCNRVKNAADSIYDPNLLMCEDFEAPTLHDNVGVGNGSPDYGPWYDSTGQTTNRGVNSYWARKYGNGVGSCIWPNGEPASPTSGSTCGFGSCTGAKVWHPSDLWQANGLKPCLTVLKNGEFGAETSAINPPTGSAGGGSGVFDGQQSLGHRNPTGLGGDAGITGTASFGGAQRTFGATMAMAYPNNIVSTRVFTDAWKHNEWHPTIGGAGGDGLFGFGYSGGLGTYTPFYGFMFVDSPNAGPAFTAACNAALAAATKTTGSFTCTDVSLFWFPGSNYTQSVDWPFGTWGCMRGYFQNMGLSNSSWQIWFTGPSGVEKKILDISGMDTSILQASGGYDKLIWNNYFNGNYDNGINTGTTSPAFRYEDNIHIRAGAPVSCSQIGFSATSGTPPPGTPPAAPSGLIVR